jgi:hypothetical protein
VNQDKFKTSYLLSVIIMVLAAITSLGGLFLANLYRDNAWTTNQLRGNDLVTAVVAVPLLGSAIIMSRRDSNRGQLVWIAMLAYMAYNYIFYLYGSAFNYFFLLYVALLSLSLWTLFMILRQLDIKAIRTNFRDNTPVKGVGAYMLVIAIVLGGMWVAQCIAFIFSGQIPAFIINAGASTSVVFASDLALLIPVMMLGGLLLWQRQAWGYLLGVVLMIKDTTYTLALLAMGWFAFQNGTLGNDWVLLPLWGVLFLGCLIATGFLLANITRASGIKESGLKSKHPAKPEKSPLIR